MRVSQYFKLDREQPTLDFVDVDVHNDVKVFIDPRAIRLLPSEWGDECTSLIQDFFRTVIQAIKGGDHDRARWLLGSLNEPNETHLGLSNGRSRGRALGADSARDVWKALRKSEAVSTGLLEDLEDTILMVEGIDRDIVSDIATNLIREPLIHYTQDACRAYGIELMSDVASGPLWDPSAKRWNQGFVELPTVEGRRLLLVPKAIVRRQMNYDAHEYFRDYILEELRREELDANSSLVQLLRSGRRRVTIKALKEKYGFGKRVIVRETLRHPELLRRYRKDKAGHTSPPPSHIELAEVGGAPPPDWDALLNEVRALKPGAEEASKYEKAIEKLLTALMYPSLTNPQSQFPIHDGRKRIDIVFTNVAETGFFRFLSLNYPASHIFVECKNYGGEVSNPELDQLAGRFSPSRGQFGMLICRHFDDKKAFIRRCIDTTQDARGFIVPLDDGDLAKLVSEAKHPLKPVKYELLKERFTKLVA